MIRKLIIHPVLGLAERIHRFGLKFWKNYYSDPSRQARVNARVISIGNITWGGTGKTPLVILLARLVRSRGKKVAVLTRGYGNDEVHELQASLAGIPVLAGRDHVKTANEAINRHQAEMIVLDDGFQHLRLGRSCDVVAINATDPWGNERLIPRGILREPLENLARADMFVLTKASLGRQNVNLIRQKLRDLNPRALVFEAEHEPVRFIDMAKNVEVDLNAIKNRKTALLTGIEDPLSFERILAHLGANIVFAARFDDHHAFTAAEVREVFKQARELQADCLVTTAKDYYRLAPVLKSFGKDAPRILVLHIEMRLDDEESFLRRCANL